MILAAIILLLVFVGIHVTAAYGIGGLKLNPEIRPVELANLLVGLFIAIFLKYYLDTRLSAKRAEQDYLIDCLRDVLEMLRSCRDAFTGCYESGKLSKDNRKSILTLVRNLSNGLETLQSAIELSRWPGLADHCAPIMNLYLAYKSTVTGGTFPSKPYPVSVASDHERGYRSLHSRLQELVFMINRRN